MRATTTSTGFRGNSSTWDDEQVDSFVRSRGRDVPFDLMCPIGHELMRDPVRTEHGGPYERNNIERWLHSHRTDPLTNLMLAAPKLTLHQPTAACLDAFYSAVLSRYPKQKHIFPRYYPSVGAIIYLTRDGKGRQTGGLLGSGTLIDSDVVLTAAHCNVSFFRPPVRRVSYYFSLSSDMSSFGENDLSLPEQTFRVARVVPHHLFDLPDCKPGLGCNNNIALMYLEQRVDTAAPSSLITEAEVGVLRPGNPISLVGYGAQPGFSIAEGSGLKHNTITKISSVGRHEMRLGCAPPARINEADTGGPAFMAISHGGAARLTVIGLASHAFDASDPLQSAVYTRVDKYLDWIRAEMLRAARDGRRPACA